MRKREERQLGLNIGSASIIMIFAILCLTVFSALSLVTSVSEKKPAQRFADETAAYYEADSEAVKIKNSIQAAIDAGNAPQQAAAANNAQYLTGQAAAALTSQPGPGTAGALQTNTGPGSAGASQNTQPNAIITYNVPLSDNISQITAVLAYNNETNTLEIISWKKNNISEWTPDTDINVWNGEDDPAENVTE